ncbi:MAG: PepSY domain-containing protein [Firmicutes bacterium]|nr:PepSY domain-containing protein [Bacillota bacterium]
MLKMHAAAWISAAALLGGAGVAGWTGIQGAGAGAAARSAAQAVGGGTVVHVSHDHHYHGQAVYDVHVLRHRLWDVKVTPAGQVVLKKLSGEQPPQAPAVPAGQAAQRAEAAVGGGTLVHLSLDHYQGQAVWDVHVNTVGGLWDVKVGATTGVILEKRPASEPPAPGGDRPDEVPVSLGGGVILHRKLTTIPAAYQGAVTAALQATGGTSVKWVKFDRRDSGGLELTIKIRTGQGTVKVKDLFAPDGHLQSQRIGSDG